MRKLPSEHVIREVVERVKAANRILDFVKSEKFAEARAAASKGEAEAVDEILLRRPLDVEAEKAVKAWAKEILGRSRGPT
jgi:hypothetical protein